MKKRQNRIKIITILCLVVASIWAMNYYNQNKEIWSSAVVLSKNSNDSTITVKEKDNVYTFEVSVVDFKNIHEKDTIYIQYDYNIASMKKTNMCINKHQ